jgi:hypothetical protein
MMNHMQLSRFLALSAACLLVGSFVAGPAAGAAAATDEWKGTATEWDACAPGKNVDWRARIVEQKGETVMWEAQFRNRSDQTMDIHYVYGASNEPRPYKDSLPKVAPGQTSGSVTFSLVNPANPRQVWMACEGKAPGVSILAASSQPAVQDRFTLEGREYGYVCSRDPEMLPAGWEKVREDAPFLSCGFGGGITVKKQE